MCDLSDEITQLRQENSKIMGMDLIPRNRIGYASYDCWAWQFLCKKLMEWGVPTGEFSIYNEGEIISETTCKRVADAIEEHLGEIGDEHRRWLEPDIEFWRSCGGITQW